MKVISRDAVLRLLDEMGAGVALRMIVGDLPAYNMPTCMNCEKCMYNADRQCNLHSPGAYVHREEAEHD